ncbi:Maf-like protein [Notoacmeibacter ruber]|uniref:7-methyl-GTP pyrophosphatase n=1 Tax=Notoacmeibacter ruber TaxID=2670375 RepID=A0A3L7JF88_9HYPH|nr:Maf-like protein [Notoacmeibacter ruber]RLQ89150.1 Maf-like protein [Notoacmeibacter ruber]
MNETIILASASPWRRQLLQDAGLTVEAVPSKIDERSVETNIAQGNAEPAHLAVELAAAKAISVSEHRPNALTLGADQVLSLNGEILHKSANLEEARERLLKLSGQTHTLSSGLVLCRNGEAIWRHVSVAKMTVRDLEPDYISRYLASVGETVLGSVGAYQIEGPGIQLFERIEGDYWTIIGLPLLPLLNELRRIGAIDG